MEAVINRFPSTDEGTLGFFVYKWFSMFTLELPWKENRRNVSCIPEGEYIMRRIYSHHFGETFEITDVPERDHILLHSGNFAGDRSKGKRTDSNGCVLTGLYPGRMYEQMCVMSSRFAHTAFMQMMKGVDQTVVKILNAKETSEC